MGEQLSQSLSFPVMLIIGINSIMGTGVFFLHAVAAGEAGPMSLISWLLMGIVAYGIGMMFAELSSMFPTAGGVYDYAKKVFGPFASFMMGWLTMIVAYVTIAMLVVGAILYLNPDLPTIVSIVLSIVFILMFNFMAYRGLDTSSVMLVTFGVITLGTVFALMVPGLFRFSPENLTPFFTHGASSVFIGVFLVAETFFGWETVTFLAEETKDAQRVIPKVLLLSTGFICVVTFLFALSALASIHWEVFAAAAAPLSDLAGVLYGSAAAPIFSILVYTSITGSVAGWIVSAPRLLMALAKDKMFIPQLARIHPKNKTPYIAIMFQTVVCSVLVMVGAGSYEALLHLLVPLVFIMYGVVGVVLFVMRSKFASQKRYYTMPAGKVLSPLIVAILAALLVYWALTKEYAPATLALAGSFLLAGVPVYLLLRFTYDPDAIKSFARVSARLSQFFESFLFPGSVRAFILSQFSFSGKRVLEFGCNVGTLTKELAVATGSDGVVIATELSPENAALVSSRLSEHSHVSVVHDEFHLSRVHPSVPVVDVVVSVGYLSMIQDLDGVLSHLRTRLPQNGRVLFAEYVDYFGFIPNAGWTADISALREVFLRNGFVVTVSKRKGLLWNYLIVQGVRSDSGVPFI